MTGLIGVFVEAWGEVRVHKARVVLSLVGVFLAVFAMTSVTGLGLIVAQVQQEQSERSTGRSATIQLSGFDQTTGAPAPAAEWDAAVGQLLDRYGVEAYATVAYRDALFRLPGGTQQLQVQQVSPSYGPLHRLQPVQGRWFREGDRTSLSPTLVVNEFFLDMLGGGDLTAPRTVVLGGARPVTATVVGVLRDGYRSPTVYRIDHTGLDDARATAAADQAAMMYGPPSVELWVPSAQVDEVMAALQADLPLLLPGISANVYRADDPSLEGTIDTLRLAVRAVGAVALLLGGLGVFNVGLMAVRQRIREIGIRRSFGATSARVFGAIMLESVVATVLAGLAAVALAVAVVDNLPIADLFNDGVPIADLPGFPVEAAVEGLLAAAGVGALAGLLPALLAVRVKVIDAIRF
ncbi:FtsX-like permease family protein [Modestobacter sp. I12A-02628]|uniref:FtsX-like permease family protein n=1 Tax=Goekera deserti TaxID=2497753 RepID=A0A7K3WG31_9ACTN|nr:ABC transporter permease [Goekera deserti]MPQ96801.1 FtsX-like permease family protein [Goekera deserti]NDI46885.1 FtsX-like permease family protein [Goekera deserti]NEL54453.1 FtsX-like permease family protein [Goekera deserti]